MNPLIKKVIVCSAVLFASLSLHANIIDRFGNWQKAQMKRSVDSLYVEVPEYTRIARLWNNMQFNRTDLDLGATTLNLKSGIQDQQCIGAAWLGFGLNAGVNLHKASQRYFTCGLNSNTAGISLSCQQGTTLNDGARSYTAHSARVGAYYVFNHRKYSYNSVFRRVFIQKRSAGSVLLSANAIYSLLQDQNPQYDYWSIAPSEGYLRNLVVSVGAGYGYNFVFGENRGYLFHISATPQLAFLNNAAILDSSFNRLESIPVGKIGAGFSASAALQYSWAERYIIGASMIDTSLRFPFTDGRSIFSRDYTAQFFFEFRF